MVSNGVRFAFIGCGNVARFHAEVITKLGYEITSVCARKDSPNIAAFAGRYNVRNTYENWQQMLEKEKPDAVIVAVSWDHTERIIEDIIKTGIPCLVEKPVALSSGRLEQIISNTRGFNTRVLIGYNRRFYDFVPKIREAIESHELLSIELNIPEAVDSMIKTYSPDIAEHVLIYMSSHWLDLLLYITGEVRVDHIYSKRNTDKSYPRSYNGLLYSLKYRVPIHLQANFNAPSQISLTFNFTGVIYRLCPVEILTIYEGMDRIDINEKNKIRRYIPKVRETFEVDTSFKPGFYAQMNNFVETCILQEKKNEIGCMLDDALKVTKLCEEIKTCLRGF